ncbi:protein pangolin, isoforms A/H/I/S isoform X5, partial [Biomphalaria glabrata]
MTMPHMSSGGSEDFYSTDEVKVYKDEGNKDEEKRSSENLTEEKLGLVTESEEGKNTSLQANFTGSDKSSNTVSDDEKSTSGPAAPGHGPPGSLGFFIPPYASAYTNGAAKFGMVQPPYPGLVMYNDFAQPPPAHKGYSPVYTDPKT